MATHEQPESRGVSIDIGALGKEVVMTPLDEDGFPNALAGTSKPSSSACDLGPAAS